MQRNWQTSQDGQSVQEAQVVATKAALLNQQWLGQSLDGSMLSSFEGLGVDACGERGEYHTLVVYSPGMRSRLELREIARLMHDGYWMLDLKLSQPGGICDSQ